jgi:uncharacterized repeat protein (TIGR03803 family)
MMSRSSRRPESPFRNNRSVRRPNVEVLEDRATPSVTLTNLFSLPTSTSTGNGFRTELTSAVAVDSAGDLFGATETLSSVTGIVTGGTVFELIAGTQTLTTLATFNAGSTGVPNSLIVDAHGNLYGTTGGGGPAGAGSVFELPVGTRKLATLATFNGTTDGSEPTCLIVSGDTLYGTTAQGGKANAGTIFSVPEHGGPIKTLASLGGTSGSTPAGGLILRNGTLYGTTSQGGAHGNGTVFAIAAAGGTLKVLSAFNGLNHAGPLATANGSLYGTFGSTPQANGGIYRLPIGGGPITTAASFTGPNGKVPLGGLTTDGTTPVGLTQAGGQSGRGTIFTLGTNGTISTLISFSGTSSAAPFGTLAADGKGNLYGTAFGNGGSTTVFFKVSGLAVSHLSFAATPDGGLAGKAMPTVKVVMTHPTAGNTVTLSLDTNPTGAILSGRLTAPVINGVATFRGLSLSKPGAGYRLVATSGAMTVLSAPFSAGPVLVFQQQPPPDVLAENPFSVAVAAETPSGAVDKAFNGTIALTLNTPGAPAGTPLTAKAVNGVALFNQLGLGPIANGFTFDATSPGTVPATSRAFNHVQQLTLTWTGKGKNSNWSNPMNWAPNEAPEPGPGAHLVFPKGAAQTTTTNDMPDFTVGSLNIGGAYSIQGYDALTVDGNITVGPGVKPTISLPLAIDAPTSKVAVAPGSTLIFQGGAAINGTGAILVEGPGVVKLNRPLAIGITVGEGPQKPGNLAFGPRLTGHGVSITLNGGSLSSSADVAAFSGSINVLRGTISLGASVALGTGPLALGSATGQVTFASATPNPATAAVLANSAFKLNAASVNFGKGTFTVAGLVTAAPGSVLNAVPGGTVQFLSGTLNGNLTIGGAGEVELGGTLAPNSQVTVTGGVVKLLPSFQGKKQNVIAKGGKVVSTT